MRRLPLVFMLLFATFMVARVTWGGNEGDEDKEKLAAAVRGAKIPLQSGLDAASAAGKPISAKFELEEGKLQLSVYIAKSGAFSEIVVDHQTGKIAKKEPIAGGADLEAAKAQEKAMAGAKAGLAAVVMKALGANKGYLAVSALPAVKAGHAVVKITLVRGESWKELTERLD